MSLTSSLCMPLCIFLSWHSNYVVTFVDLHSYLFIIERGFLDGKDHTFIFISVSQEHITVSVTWQMFSKNRLSKWKIQWVFPFLLFLTSRRDDFCLFFFTLIHTKLLILCLWTGEEHGCDLSTGYTWKKGLFNVLHAPRNTYWLLPEFFSWLVRVL